jgi:hypothetical protein
LIFGATNYTTKIGNSPRLLPFRRVWYWLLQMCGLLAVSWPSWC